MKEFFVNRYDYTGNYRGSGKIVISNSDNFEVLYHEGDLCLSGMDPYHPMIALEKLRIQVEDRYESVVGLVGCRKDTAYRITGGFGSYRIEYGKQATERVSIFDRCDNVAVLATVKDHKALYKKWLSSLGKDNSD